MGYVEKDYFHEARSKAGSKHVCPVCNQEQVTPYSRPTFSFWLYNCENCHVSGSVVSFHAAAEGIPYGEAYNQLKSKDRDLLEARRLFSCQGKFRDILDESRKNAKNNPEQFQKCFNGCGIPYEIKDLPKIKSKVGLIREEDGHLKGILNKTLISEPKLVVPAHIIPDVIGSICLFGNGSSEWVGPKKHSSITPASEGNIPIKFIDFGYEEFTVGESNSTIATQNPRIALFLASVLEFSGCSGQILLFSSKNSFMQWDLLENSENEVYLIVDEGLSPSIGSYYHSNLKNSFIFKNIGDLKDKFSEFTPRRAINALKKSSRNGKWLIKKAATGKIDLNTEFQPTINDLCEAYDDFTPAVRDKIEERWGVSTSKSLKKLGCANKNGYHLYYVNNNQGISRKTQANPDPIEISNFHLEHQKILSTPLGEWFHSKALSHVKGANMLLPQNMVNPDITKGDSKKLISVVNSAGIGPSLMVTTENTRANYMRILTELANKANTPMEEHAFAQPTREKYVVYLPYATVKINGPSFDDIRVVPPLFSNLDRVKGMNDKEVPDNPSQEHKKNVVVLSSFLIDSNPEKTLYSSSNEQLNQLLAVFNPNNRPIKGYITSKDVMVKQFSKDLHTEIPWREEYVTLSVTEGGDHRYKLKNTQNSIEWYPKAVALTYYRWIKAGRIIPLRRAADMVFSSNG